ncbi:phytanoyl-CoA dioxygenase family protein [Pseudomonas profundi]|uniref:hypothetical protein n=1 Tax=Pseudomonas profundi TaxID=1981513 RepID=UPI001238C103|nr:hypothetical protein [Pseudomonas profundi]
MTEFTPVDAQVVSRLASEIESNGYAVFENFFTPEQLEQAREYIRAQTSKHNQEYFSIHGIEAMEGSVLASLGGSTTFKQFLSDMYEQVTGFQPPVAERIFPVIRCLQGKSGLKESHFYHFDATAVTALAPVFIPTEGQHCGDLIIFPNVRPVRSSAVLNIAEKAVMHNKLSQKLTAIAVKRGLLKPITVKLVPGNLYLFWGYRSLHSNDQCDPENLRATGLYHFGNPHRESSLARIFLGKNKRKAKLDHDGLRPQT